VGHRADLRPPMSLNDRMYYLAQALTSAKSAASLGSEDVEFTSSLQERIDVAQVQTEVGRAIAGHKEMAADEKNESLKQLDSRLLGLDEVS
jgi:nuclear pore complex protein Nup155